MSLSPGALLGLPPGFPDPVQDLSWIRYLIVALAALWIVLQLSGRRIASVLAALAFVSVAVGFWVLVLGRPYGLFVDADATRRAAEASVVATSGRAEGVLAAGPPAAPVWIMLGRLGPPARALVLLPTILPLLALLLIALLVRAVWADRRHAAVAAVLWLAFSTGDLDAVRDAGFVSGCWAHPESALVLLLVVASALALGRTPSSGPVATGLASLPLAAWFVLGSPAHPAGASEAALLLTVDQGWWLLLGGVGLFRGRDPAARGLAIGGAIVVLAAAAGAPVDPWGALAGYRLGLILAAAGPFRELAAQAGEWAGRWPYLAGAGPVQSGAASLLLVALPGSFLVWWDPIRLDPAARDSIEALSPVVERAMEWIRRETPRDAVFVASAEYAPQVAVLAGRRVLRAPSLVEAADDADRLRAERLLLSGRDAGPLLDRYHLTHVFIAPGDFRARGVRRPEDLEAYGRLRLRHADASGLTVYEIVRP